ELGLYLSHLLRRSLVLSTQRVLSVGAPRRASGGCAHPAACRGPHMDDDRKEVRGLPCQLQTYDAALTTSIRRGAVPARPAAPPAPHAVLRARGAMYLVRPHLCVPG